MTDSAEKVVAELLSGADGWEIAVADEIRLYGEGTEDAIGMQARADMYRRAAALIESQRATIESLRRTVQMEAEGAQRWMDECAAAEARVTALEAEKAGAWEAGMREAARIAEQRFEDDPEYCVYADGPEIAVEIRRAIRVQALSRGTEKTDV